jgi:ribosome-binding factor A
MTVDRIKRVNELLRREIAGVLYRVIPEGGLDLAAVTVTDVSVSRDLRHARVMVSIRAQPAQQAGMLATLRRHRAEVQHAVSRAVVLRYMPRLSFELDPSVARGDHVLEILEALDVPPEPQEPAP